MLTLQQLANLVNYHIDSLVDDPRLPVYAYTEDGERHEMLSLSFDAANDQWALCVTDGKEES